MFESYKLSVDLTLCFDLVNSVSVVVTQITYGLMYLHRLVWFVPSTYGLLVQKPTNILLNQLSRATTLHHGRHINHLQTHACSLRFSLFYRHSKDLSNIYLLRSKSMTHNIHFDLTNLSFRPHHHRVQKYTPFFSKSHQYKYLSIFFFDPSLLACVFINLHI